MRGEHAGSSRARHEALNEAGEILNPTLRERLANPADERRALRLALQEGRVYQFDRIPQGDVQRRADVHLARMAREMG